MLEISLSEKNAYFRPPGFTPEIGRIEWAVWASVEDPWDYPLVNFQSSSLLIELIIDFSIYNAKPLRRNFEPPAFTP